MTINLAVDGVYDDAAVEGTEYASLEIGSGSGYVATSSSGSAAIYDNDVEPPTVFGASQRRLGLETRSLGTYAQRDKTTVPGTVD